MEIYLLAYMLFGATLGGITLRYYYNDESRVQGEAVSMAVAVAILGPAVLAIGAVLVLVVIFLLVTMTIVGITKDKTTIPRR